MKEFSSPTKAAQSRHTNIIFRAPRHIQKAQRKKEERSWSVAQQVVRRFEQITVNCREGGSNGDRTD